MQRNRRKRKGRHGKHHKDAIDQSRHKAATLRQKREYVDNAFWDPHDSEYEEPLIYDSMDTANVESSGRKGGDTLKKKKSLGDNGGEKYVCDKYVFDSIYDSHDDRRVEACIIPYYIVFFYTSTVLGLGKKR